MVHSVSGALGIAGNPQDVDSELIGTSYEPISLVKGASIVRQSAAYDVLRGGHCDLLMVGAL